LLKTDKKMGRKKLVRTSVERLLSTVSSMLVPAHVLKYFDIWDAKESKTRWVIEMREKEGNIPKELSEYEDIVFDGYTNPLETLSHSFVCKPVYLRLYRRRYKRSNRDVHYSNEYDVTLKGVRMVPELGIFLKGAD
jgi:hypothetical protein